MLLRSLSHLKGQASAHISKVTLILIERKAGTGLLCAPDRREETLQMITQREVLQIVLSLLPKSQIEVSGKGG